MCHCSMNSAHQRRLPITVSAMPFGIALTFQRIAMRQEIISAAHCS